ncbi:MAG: tRNA pseudouridine(38-40) synthase TruA [Bacteriovoracaceae bacterium]|nr:tRNA pseudouridine(38-40) synthase TruA [Bacteriovoracaceae bacterium]
MHYYKATIQYDGTDYAGFQWQKNAPTIQSDLNQAIQQILSGKVTTMGASRTDTGVHALEQVVKISCEHPLEPEIFLTELRRTLPPQIKCLQITTCHGEFKPAKEPVSKEYRYYFTNIKSAAPDCRFLTNYYYPLNIEKMQQCVALLIGTHNFQNFYSTGSNVTSTVREIFVSELTQVNPQTFFADSPLFHIPDELQICYQLKIVGKGFLKQMIRHLMSALWLVGSEKMTVKEFMQLLEGPKQEKRKWKPAVAKGLFLYQISYRD